MKSIYRGDISKLDDIDKLKELLIMGVPVDRRLAARRLYELGEKDLGLMSLIKEMNQYKDSKVSNTTKYESCTSAAILLGSLGDARAIDDLLEALPDLQDSAAYGLSQIGTERAKNELIKLASYENPSKLYALYGLGFMGIEDCIDPLIEINSNIEKYKQIYRQPLKSISFISLHILGVLNNHKARRFFLENIDEKYVEIFLSDFWEKEYFSKVRYLTELGYKIVLNYGWDKYFNTPQDKQIFDMRIPPDNTEVMKRRKEIVIEVLMEAKGRRANT